MTTCWVQSPKPTWERERTDLKGLLRFSLTEFEITTYSRENAAEAAAGYESLGFRHTRSYRTDLT